MKVQSSRLKAQGFGMILLLFAAFCILPPLTRAGEKWSGVDESVIKKVAKEHGQETRKPFINTDQGDLLLFLFLLAGAVGGFIAGYYWRALTGENTDQVKNLKEDV